jgi:hypothetical protein
MFIKVYRSISSGKIIISEEPICEDDIKSAEKHIVWTYKDNVYLCSAVCSFNRNTNGGKCYLLNRERLLQKQPKNRLYSGNYICECLTKEEIDQLILLEGL